MERKDRDYGSPPKSGWAKLVCELLVEDIDTSLQFWRDQLSFSIAYQRPEQKFVYLECENGAQIMLWERAGKWETAELEPPFGRGGMFQIYVDQLAPIVDALAASDWPLVEGPREVWRRWGAREGGSVKSLFRTRMDI